ncbi:ZIP zinc transporter-domain-containing protein [Dissophora ornata]|nr:hypothetical protein BGZ58_001138 [Dissophora ornata]KAI8602723.1 ZIP zinc transporter-domain-containing protein [Dissophora ornata]
MDPFFSLILLCIAMLVASFLAGNIPLSFHLSEERLKLISNFGVGLLVGTSLVVIIPEGVDTMYSVPHPAAAPSSFASAGASGPGLNSGDNLLSKRSYIHPDIAASGLTLVSGIKKAAANAGLAKRRSDVVVMKADHAYMIQDQFKQNEIQTNSFEDNMLMTRQADKIALQHDFERLSGLDQSEKTGQSNSRIVKRQDGEDDQMDGLLGGQDNENSSPSGRGEAEPSLEDGTAEENNTSKYVGLALLSGFILMFLIDQVGPTHAHGHNNHVSVADFTELHNLQLDDSNIRMPSAVVLSSGAKKRGNPITVGLVVHAAADGIALGASASRPELRFIVFLAIMLHKGPAAFGLATVLLQHGFSRRQTRQQVGIFSLAAPIGALLTYVFIQMSGQHDEASLHWWTGLLLLFSGGTFLYVAMHVMSEMNNPETSAGHVGGDKGQSVVEVLSVIGGMVVPLILSVDHGH